MRGDHRRCQAEKPLIVLFRFPEPALDAAFVTARCRTLVVGDIEAQMIADGLEAELRTVLTSVGVAGAATANQAALLGHLRDHKTAYAAELATMMRGNTALAGRMPQAFRDSIADLRGLP